jgi:hypothetical protein
LNGIEILDKRCLGTLRSLPGLLFSLFFIVTSFFAVFALVGVFLSF